MKSGLDETITNLKNEMKTEPQLLADYESRMNKLEEQIKNIPSLNLDNILASLREKIDEVNKQNLVGIDDPKYEALIKKVEDIERSIMNMSKPVSSPQKIDVEPRTLKVDNVIKEIPKNVADEIDSLKDIVSRISSENNGLKRVIRDIRINQMETITSDVFVSLIARVSTIEKKLSEIEEEISKMRPNQ
jgi:hypothetical protein